MDAERNGLDALLPACACVRAAAARLDDAALRALLADPDARADLDAIDGLAGYHRARVAMRLYHRGLFEYPVKLRPDGSPGRNPLAAPDTNPVAPGAAARRAEALGLSHLWGDR